MVIDEAARHFGTGDIKTVFPKQYGRRQGSSSYRSLPNSSPTSALMALALTLGQSQSSSVGFVLISVFILARETGKMCENNARHRRVTL